MSTDIPRNYPALPPLGGWFTDEEVQAVMETLRDSMDWRTGFGGPEIGQFEAAFAAVTGSRYALVMNSGTATLHSAYFAVGVGPGDEVLVPSYTWHASATPVIHCAATPVFCDIRPESLTIDPVDLERRITPRTKALCVVHVFGNGGDLARLVEQAARARGNDGPRGHERGVFGAGGDLQVLLGGEGRLGGRSRSGGQTCWLRW